MYRCVSRRVSSLLAPRSIRMSIQAGKSKARYETLSWRETAESSNCEITRPPGRQTKKVRKKEKIQKCVQYDEL